MPAGTEQAGDTSQEVKANRSRLIAKGVTLRRVKMLRKYI